MPFFEPDPYSPHEMQRRLYELYDSCYECGMSVLRKGREYGKECVKCQKCGNRNALIYWISVDECLPEGEIVSTSKKIVGFYCNSCYEKWGKWWK
jgi:hypothetical protein